MPRIWETGFKVFFGGRTDSTAIQIIRSVLSSILGFAVDFGTLAFLVELIGLHYLPAGAVGFAAGTTCTYLLSIKWIFGTRRVQDKRLEYGVFFGVGIAGIALNSALMWVFTDLVSIHYMISKIMSSTIGFFFNFFARRQLLFTKRRGKTSSAGDPL